jgi:hypothetical protein
MTPKIFLWGIRYISHLIPSPTEGGRKEQESRKGSRKREGRKEAGQGSPGSRKQEVRDISYTVIGIRVPG